MTSENTQDTSSKDFVPLKELYDEITTKGSSFCYPHIYNDTDADFLGYIIPLIERYVERVNQLDKNSIFVLNTAFSPLPSHCKPKKKFDFLRDLRAVSDMVLEVLTCSYRCFPDEAYQRLREFFEKDDYFYLNMIPRLKIEYDHLYRIRTGNFDKTKDGEIFHIPFEKRHLVSSMRYSIPGYPILYLAESLFTAWCEMNKPELEEMSFASFRFKEPAIFLDLGYPLQGHSAWEWYCLFAMYPLLMACMVRVKYPSAPFKPEYIMPQLMTKLVREYSGLFTGIVYMSNKLPDACSVESPESRNFAVCTYNCICQKGHDQDLAAKMEMTDIKTISRDDIRKSVTFEDGKYSVDFKALQKMSDYNFRDIDVSMDLGESTL